MKYLATLFVLAALCFTTMNAANVTSVAGGKAAAWSSPMTWSNGGVPTAADIVTITDNDTITLDQDATIAGLIVGTTTGAVFQTNKATKVALTVNGDITISTGSTLKASTNAATGELINTITLTGNFDAGKAKVLDCRVGTAGSNMGVLNFILTGSTNTVFTTAMVYSSSTNELNGMTINKSGTGKVILGSNISFGGGSSSFPLSTTNLVFINGLVETGPFILIHNSTTSLNIAGASSKSYVNGALARGMSSGGATTKDFAVGDSAGYRPLKLHSLTGGSITGHYAVVRCVRGNANTGTSTLAGGIDKVSEVRYYEIRYGADIAGAPTSMTFDKFTPMYGTDDGVSAGNTDLRLAFSTDKRATWTGISQSKLDTTFVTDTLMTADSVSATGIAIDSTQAIYIALARATGTTTNSLKSPTTSVHQESTVPAVYSLEQNYPNPFNPSTTVKFSIAAAQDVRLTVYDLLGRSVATLVNEHMGAGTYAVQWNASSVPSGVYFYRLEAGSFSNVKKLMLLK
jgi:hypothetical protein